MSSSGGERQESDHEPIDNPLQSTSSSNIIVINNIESNSSLSRDKNPSGLTSSLLPSRVSNPPTPSVGESPVSTRFLGSLTWLKANEDSNSNRLDSDSFSSSSRRISSRAMSDEHGSIQLEGNIPNEERSGDNSWNFNQYRASSSSSSSNNRFTNV